MKYDYFSFPKSGKGCLYHTLLVIFTLVLWGCDSSKPDVRTEIRIAAASDTQYLFRALKPAFETAYPEYEIKLTHAASGTLTSQIEQGGPFDIFFSADLKYPQRLIENNHAEKESLLHYGTGTLILWIPEHMQIEKEKFTLEDLLKPEFKKIAIANPAHAPYGELAKRALEGKNLFTSLESKFILGENVSQTYQFVETGKADAGFISLSLTKSRNDMPKGKIVELPEALNPWIKQYAVRLKKSTNPRGCEKFYEFLKTKEGRDLLKLHGFGEK